MHINRGDTRTFLMEFKDKNNVYFDPDTDSIAVSFYDSKKTLIETVTSGIVHTDTGKYSLEWTIPLTAEYGEWQYIIRATKNSTYFEREPFRFTVEKASGD